MADVRPRERERERERDPSLHGKWNRKSKPNRKGQGFDMLRPPKWWALCGFNLKPTKSPGLPAKMTHPHVPPGKTLELREILGSRVGTFKIHRVPLRLGFGWGSGRNLLKDFVDCNSRSVIYPGVHRVASIAGAGCCLSAVVGWAPVT